MRHPPARLRGVSRATKRAGASAAPASAARPAQLCSNVAASPEPLPHTVAAKEKNMKASEVRILPALDPGDSYVEPVFLLVETTLRDDGEPLTTIEHISSDGGHGWSVKTLGHVPVTHSAACEWAVSYAASRNIPVVYERDETATTGQAAALSAGAGGNASAPVSSRAK